MRLEDSGLNRQISFAAGIEEVLVQQIRLIGRRGCVKTGAPALTAVAVQGKLRDHQECTAGFGDTAIHFARLIGKNSQASHLVDEVVRGFFSVRFGYSKQHQEPASDSSGNLSIHFHPGLRHSLEHDTHMV